ncbi:hypothetical protein U1Q18_025059 [Sarracenia purpurea var. burkii]
MARFTILAAALVVILLALTEAAAASLRTTITTTVVEEDNPRGSQDRCRQQMQRQQELRHCQGRTEGCGGGPPPEMYLSEGRRSEIVMTTGQNPQRQEHLQQCCQQLENMDEQCRCEAIKMMVRRQQQEEGEREEMREMMQEAEKLPSMCNLSPRRCQIRAVWF